MAKTTAKQKITPIVRGDRYRRTHRASVIGVLGRLAPPVISRGSRFYNLDRWTARVLVSEMCKWAGNNPGCTPTQNDVADWVIVANTTAAPERCIVIANTPDKLPLKVALGLTGGAYHEAFHTKYSCRRALQVDECADIILPRWAMVKDWSGLHQALQDWNNIIEDIHIERRGREDFEGSHTKLANLRDFVLDQETEGATQLRAQGGKPGSLSVIMGAFRDIGHGYNTERQREAFAEYKKDNQDAVDLVLDGPLTPMLRESIEMDAKDDLGCIRVAMDVVAKLAELGGLDESDEKAQDGQHGDGQQGCRSCGAPASKIVVRPLSDGKGGKVKGKGIATCTACGYQEEVDIRKKTAAEKAEDKANKEAGKQAQQGPIFVGFNEDDLDGDEGDSGGGGGSGDEDGEDGNGNGTGADGDEDGDGSDSGTGKDGDEGDGDGAGGGSGGDSDDGAEGSDTGDSNPDGGDTGGEQAGQGANQGSSQSHPGIDQPDISSDPGQPGGAGGHHHAEGVHEGNEHAWEEIAEQALNDALSGKGTHILDNNAALERALNSAEDKEDRDTQKEEAPWRPYNPCLDEALLVQPSRKGREHDMSEATKLVKSVTSESAYTRARLRNIVRALEMTSTVHGVPKGRNLSARYLVDSKAALKGQEMPKRAYYRRGVQMDTSMAAAVVVDESGSMGGWLTDAARIMISITEPLDALNCPTLVLGFRDGRRGLLVNEWHHDPEEDKKNRGYHRYDGVTYDIFKQWHEGFRTVKWRFANTRATGGTPMADGIQYALHAISCRTEAHRFIFVVTDGCPNRGHEKVITRQIRRAKKANIHLVGVGMGCGAQYVKKLFEDYVYSNDIPGIPRGLIVKMNELVDTRLGRRGILYKDKA